jgi:HEAT repeat protein
MAKSRGTEAKLNRLQALRRDAPAPNHVPELRQALADSSNLVAAEAAEIVAERNLGELAIDLVAAFDRFMIDPEETDKLCRAKLAITDALNKIEYDEERVFLDGVRHVQFEARWGKPEDTAGPLRGSSAFGLLRLNHRDIMSVLADLLADPDKAARLAAVRALGESRFPAAVPLLRFKVRTGDKDPEVLSECLGVLLAATPKESLALAAELLNSPTESTQEAAAFALGECRRPDALELLLRFWPRAHDATLQEVVLFAISTTRLPAAIDFLLAQLSGDDRRVALATLNALAIHRHHDATKQRIAAAIEAIDDRALHERFAKKFEG